MLLLTRILVIWVVAALFAGQAFVWLRTGQVNLHGRMIKRRRYPLAFWATLAIYLLFALICFVMGVLYLTRLQNEGQI